MGESAINNIPMQQGIELLTQADDSPLTQHYINELSGRLGIDWKRFARNTEYFNEAVIEGVDVEEQRVSEKCVKMIRLWQQRCDAEVTIAMVKLNLVAMGRNDLLNTIFNVVVPTNNNSFGAQQHGNIFRSSPHMFTELTISDLRYKHIEKISTFLDMDHGVGVHNWKQLGTSIFAGNQDAKDQMDALHRAYFGGGSAAKRFFKSLEVRNPMFTVGEFREICVKLKRMDVRNYIDSLNCAPSQQFCDLTFAQLDRLSVFLDKCITGVSDWRMFADTLNFTNYEISALKHAQREPNEYSPTRGLFDLMKQRYPLLQLSKLKQALSLIGRTDVAKYVETVIEELTRHRV